MKHATRNPPVATQSCRGALPVGRATKHPPLETQSFRGAQLGRATRNPLLPLSVDSFRPRREMEAFRMTVTSFLRSGAH